MSGKWQRSVRQFGSRDEVKIEKVNISGTSVTHLSKEFVFSSKLKELKMDGCPLVFPPIEVCNQGIPVIREYFRELDKVGGVRRGRIKILVMGTTMAGKTSFVEALESGKPFLAEPDERTIGVVEKVMKLDDKIECKLLDCGGHRAYMLTNQLFISDNSLVLIVVDSNQYKFTQQCFRQNIADFLQVVYDRNSRAHIAIVVSKVDLMVDMSREEMSRKWNEHLHTCLRQFLKIRQAEIDGMAAASDFPKKKYVSERLQFFDLQQITVEKNVLLTSAATHEGVVSVKDRLGELYCDERLLPSLHTKLPSSWVTVEDKLIKPQPHTSVPITDVSYAMQLCVEHGLTEESCRELLNYLNQVGSILYYSHHPTLAEVLFPIPPFVVTLLKAVFRHDHESLEYDHRFRSVNISRDQFENMHNDLVSNGIARISMLLVLWSEFLLTEDRYVDVFIKLFLALDFGYLTGSSDDVVQELGDTLGRRQITSTSPVSTNTTSYSSGQVIEENHHQEQTDRCKEMIFQLKQHNVGLLLPWLLNDEKPEDVGKLWSSDIPHGVMQVSVKYSFAYDRPLGLFERLSARCHRHSNYICHWSSGLLMCYGAVTLHFDCSKNISPGFICLSGRVVKSHHSVGRLWHVLLRCVSDMEDLLQSVPGVLPDRFIYSGSSSTTSRKSPLSRAKQFVPNERWGSFAVDATAGRYSAEMAKHINAVQHGK
ncbi:malignant fibrous histiocytoma-amplified sequence 1 homolog [Corticium candelabrum]|uniref:malignant fibrous histiocytoma-amplified sequence 1 homolog n=1 Tax=Corticium candelabrum TaxID=121492 RepID=UPI002E26071F|nr:malignant fibrous histiocytoma-amplified sequence 1 homolog [Corticium candelabrum]